MIVQCIEWTVYIYRNINNETQKFLSKFIIFEESNNYYLNYNADARMKSNMLPPLKLTISPVKLQNAFCYLVNNFNETLQLCILS